MTTKVRRARPSPARQAKTTQQKSIDPRQAYRRLRAAIGLAVLLLFFVWLWFLNGDFTAQGAVKILGFSYGVGWAIHLLQTGVELLPAFVRDEIAGMPRFVRIVIYALALPFGVFDVLSSAIGVAPYMAWTGATGLLAHVQNTALGELIAFTPEPMIVWLSIALIFALKGR